MIFSKPAWKGKRYKTRPGNRERDIVIHDLHLGVENGSSLRKAYVEVEESNLGIRLKVLCDLSSNAGACLSTIHSMYVVM